jgi:2-hydroxychromene-2-carboxylate isomerase
LSLPWVIAIRGGRAFDEEGIFGVPTIVLVKGTRFWRHDRIEWAIDKDLISD